MLHCYDLNASHAGVAQLVARLLAMQKVCGFESRHLLTVEQIIVKTSKFINKVLCISIEAFTSKLKIHGTLIGGVCRSSYEVTALVIFSVYPIRHLGSKGVLKYLLRMILKWGYSSAVEQMAVNH